MYEKVVLLLVTLTAFLVKVDAECANACNGHGKCTSYDMCICNRNWQANDCSERVCQFGLAHVDTPKGDLNMDGDISNANIPVAENSFNYPYGTTEQFPLMEDSDLNELTNSAHYYMECSNKGKCDRSTGECVCYDGYDGVACQRASCPGFPNSCSGHGVCKSISQLAKADNWNVYKLWDKDASMGCECDFGYFGADCSQSDCKHGVDPLYLDDSATIKYSTYNFATLVTANAGVSSGDNAKADACTSTRCLFTDGQSEAGDGYWAIRFYDAFGEDWLTAPIQAGASCASVVSALEALPNNVIPAGYTYCTRIEKLAATSQTDSDRDPGSGVFVDGQTNGWHAYDSQHPFNSPSLHNHPWHIYYDLAFWEAELTADNQGSASMNAADPNPTLTLGEDNPYVPLAAFQSSAGTSENGIEATTETDKYYYIRGYIYNIHFFGNPGALKEPQIELYLDGKRPSLVGAPYKLTADSKFYGPKVITKVWTDGQQGEDNDYFADHCDGVTVTIKHWGGSFGTYVGAPTGASNKLMGISVLSGMTAAEINLLKACLGESDFDTSNNNEVYNWDYGSMYYPHIIKLVRTVTTYTDGGYYVALVAVTSGTAVVSSELTITCSATTPCFKLLNPFNPPDELATDQYEIYTTKGTLALTSNRSEATASFGSKYIYMTNVSYDTVDLVKFDGDISCEIGNNNADKMSYLFHCLNKTDIFTVLNYISPQFNPPHINLYTAQRLYTKPYQYSVSARYPVTQPNTAVQSSREMHYMTHVITTDLSTNWGMSTENDAPFLVYKFFPAEASTYNYVAPCSNRGICNHDNGVCQCFSGYTSDSCGTQSSIAL